VTPEKTLPPSAPGWVWARLDQVADIVGGVTKDAKRQRDPSFVEVPYLRVANVQRGFLDLTKVETIRVPADKAAALLLRPGDLLFTEGGDRDKLGRGWVWEGQIEDCIHQNHIFRARLLTKELEPKFISWYGNTFGREWFEAAGKQTTNLASISLTTLKSFPIPIPPAAEQQRIVAEVERQLSKVDAGVSALRHARPNLRRVRTIVLKEATYGHLAAQDLSDEPAIFVVRRALETRSVFHSDEEQGRQRLEQEPLFSTRSSDDGPVSTAGAGRLPELPLGWVWARLEQLAHIITGVTKDAKRQTDPSFVEVPYLRVANVQRGFLDLRDVATIRVSPDKASLLELKQGDILFTEGGDRDKLGRGWIWEGQIDNCIHQNHIFRARLYSGDLEPKFISWHGNTFGQAWFEAAGKQTTNLASIGLPTLKSLPVPVPPAAEQRRIVAEVERQLSLIEAAEGEVERGLGKAVSLRRAILQAAFDGRLVPQDPTDEPAATLLERIAAARASQARGRRDRTEQGTLL
jgi:type I restriction enzyme, S subunit